MVKAVVDGRVFRVPVTGHLLAEEEVAREEEPGLGGEPRQRENEEPCCQRDPQRVAVRAIDERDAVPAGGVHGEGKRERNAERRHNVDEPRVEVALVDDAGNGRGRAERDRRPDEPPRSPRGRRQPDRHQGDRVVEERQGAREASGQVTGLVDVVELCRLEPRVGDENRGELEAKEPPDRERFP